MSYSQILLRWSKAVVKAQFAPTITNLAEAQETCDDYGSAILAIVGTKGYENMLRQLFSAVETYRSGERSEIL